MHNEYWLNVKRDAKRRICALFDACKAEADEIIAEAERKAEEEARRL